MESLAIVLSVPMAFLGAVVYSFLLGKTLPYFPWIRPLFLWASAAVLLGIVAEFTAIRVFGAIAIRTRFGPAFEYLESVLFILGCPALVNVLVLPRRGIPRLWPLVAAVTGVLAFFLTMNQYDVSDALYGVDGSGGPFSPPGAIRPR